MTLQCLYLVLKEDPQYKTKHSSNIRELINIIIVIASLDMNGTLLFAFDQFIQYLQTNDRVKEANLFTDLFFGHISCKNIFSK